MILERQAGAGVLIIVIIVIRIKMNDQQIKNLIKIIIMMSRMEGRACAAVLGKGRGGVGGGGGGRQQMDGWKCHTFPPDVQGKESGVGWEGRGRRQAGGRAGGRAGAEGGGWDVGRSVVG